METGREKASRQTEEEVVADVVMAAKTLWSFRVVNASEEE